CGWNPSVAVWADSELGLRPACGDWCGTSAEPQSRIGEERYWVRLAPSFRGIGGHTRNRCGGGAGPCRTPTAAASDSVSVTSHAGACAGFHGSAHEAETERLRVFYGPCAEACPCSRR